MKRILFLGVLALLLSFPMGIVNAAEIYWDGMPADEEITDDDFKLKYGVPSDTKSLGDLEIYDNNLLINVPGPDDPVEPDYESGAPIPPRAVTAPRSMDVAPPQPRIAPRTTEPGTTRGPTVRRTPTQAPKPATQEIESPPRPATEQAAPDQPPATGEKKMKWGQVDVKPSEPKTKFQWGEKK
jgi:hypothetical protein